MKTHMDSFSAALVFLTLLVPIGQTQGQGTLQWTVTFEGPPYLLSDSAVAVQYYYEQGMVFEPIAQNGRFGRSGGAEAVTAFPRNGTAYIEASFGYSLSVSSFFGARFGLVSVDLAEFSTLYQTPLAVQFVGYKPDGSVVMTEFVTDGIIDGAGPQNDFETFYFDARFADMVRVEVPTYRWSLDNMVFSNVVPEPTTGTVLLLGGAGLWFLARRKNRTRQRADQEMGAPARNVPASACPARR